MSEVKYKICSRAELPVHMQGEMSCEQAFDLVVAWNESHVVADMAFPEPVDEPEGRSRKPR
jgi:hypothetical protein